VTEVPSATREVVVGRQPIVDADGRLVGYELLYRSARTTPAVLTGAQMTAEVLLGALTIGLDQLVGDKLLFCNADRQVLLGEPPVALSPRSTVIEVLESVTIDEEVLASCRALVDRGFQLALDDFVWADGVEELLDLAWVVKIDVLAYSREEVVELVRRCGAHDVLLLAEKVETAEQLAWAREVGFHLFQGYVIERPAHVHGRALPASTTAHLRLAMHVLLDEIDFVEIEEVLRREPGLVVQLLQMASRGSDHGLRREVRTIREALVLLGSVRVRQWIALTLLQEHRSANTESVFTALVRAKACEILARPVLGSGAETAFTAGLLSALDLLLGVPAEELVEALDLDAGLKRVAFERVGEVGTLVSHVAAFQDDLARGFPVPADPTLADVAIADAVAEAVAWAAPQVTALA
jgi:EAL and modified HD-GYP domain-containing signal transduction protein